MDIFLKAFGLLFLVDKAWLIHAILVGVSQMISEIKAEINDIHFINFASILRTSGQISHQLEFNLGLEQ